MKKKCLLVCLLCCLLLGLALAEEPMTETVLFEGSQPASGGWNLALTIDTTNVNGTFDPSLISENGYFAVTYDGVQNGVYLALSDWEGGVWAQINVPSTCTQTDGMYTAVFSFEQCRMAYGSMDFAAADQICVGTSASTKTMRCCSAARRRPPHRMSALSSDSRSTSAAHSMRRRCVRTAGFTSSIAARNTVCIWHSPAIPARRSG